MPSLLQSYIQRQANPDRTGCPAVRRLEALLQNHLQPAEIDGLYHHLVHCRECLLELKTLRDVLREEKE